jgi:hypothetical protein
MKDYGPFALSVNARENSLFGMNRGEIFAILEKSH